MKFKDWLATMNSENEDNDSNVIEVPPVPVVPAQQLEPETPKMYVVVLHNNDYTPFQIVVATLQNCFHLNLDVAEAIMIHAHQHGKAQIGGTFTKDVAEAKAQQAVDYAAVFYSRPLIFTAEPV